VTRLLVVEDDKDIALALRLLLDRSGYAVEHAGDGRTGLRMVHELHPDLLVLDIGLPVMDGYELARRLRWAAGRDPAAPPLRLIALSGYGEHSDRERSREAGFVQHLVKPVDLDALMALIRHD